MYFDKVDDIVDRIIDDFYTFTLRSSSFEKIKSETNFAQYQKQLNKMIEEYSDTIPQDLLDDITKNSDNLLHIRNTLIKYCFIYTFLTIGLHYTGKNEIYINNIVEFSKKQSQFTIKLDNFFNADSNSTIIQMYYICRNVINLVSREHIKPELIKTEPYATYTIDFLDNLPPEVINMRFRLKSLNDNKSMQSHNVIKTIILIMLYTAIDKKDLNQMIELSNNAEGEYMFIEIIEQSTNTINFNSIETILNKNELINGFAHDVWKFLEHVEYKKTKLVSNEDKINILINAGIVVPILDDFLLYHNDNEKYDHSIGQDNAKKREDTKIRYLINKVDAVTDLYSLQAKKDPLIRGNIMKNFYNHLHYRKAVLRNNFEEINIINKYLHMGNRNMEIVEYLNDMLHYRRYTYVNFKDFEKYGFSHHFTKSVSSVRSVNMETSGDFVQTSNNRLQLRVGSKDTQCNIVGLMIPTNTRPLQCLRVIDCIDIRSLNKHTSNGFDLFLNFLKYSKIKAGRHKSSVYWLFDMELDTFKSKTTDGNLSSIATQDNVKNMIGVLYDNFIEAMYFQIIDRLDIYPDLTVNHMHHIIQYMENHIGVPCTEEIKKNIERYYFEKKVDIITLDESADVDILYGLEGNIVELHEYKEKQIKLFNRIDVDLSKVSEIGQLIEIVRVVGVCQHNVTWESISELRKKNTQEYLTQLYLFIQQYVIENTQGAYVCRSCGYYLDIRRYVADGTFDNDTQKFITYSMPMEANLEDLPEYEKFNFAIKIMDRNIEKIASSVGISYFVGTGTTIKWRRKAIIKNTIDMVMLNNVMMTKKKRERDEFKEKLYGVSRLSNLFTFTLENNIFQLSTKDKDREQYKMIKKNNIIVYMMIYMILELNESHLLFFLSDKKNMADIKIFNVVYPQLFGGLRIKKNNTNDVVDIVKYRILCYMIYMISCRIAKHRMWFGQQSVEKNIQKMIPIIQKFIVHTTVDLINCILENSYEPGVSYLFEVFRVRFLTNLRTLYSNDILYKRLIEQSQQTVATARRRSDLKIISDDMIKQLSPIASSWRLVVPSHYVLPTQKLLPFNMFNITNITNCADGKFHIWKSNGNFICTLCKATLVDQTYDRVLSEKIKKKYSTALIVTTAQQMCMANDILVPHHYIYDGKDNTCTNCNNHSTHQYSDKDLKKITDIINKIRNEKLAIRYETIERNKEAETKENNYREKIIERLNQSFAKNDQFEFINRLIDSMISVVGSEIKGADVTNLYDNLYIIDHDHNGYDLGGKNIIISQTEEKIQYRENHPFFKTNCIYFTDNRSGRIDVFYDAISKRLLGYKEQSREFTKVDTNKRIRINYSIANKLKMMGFSGEYIYLEEDYPHLATDRFETMTSTEKNKYHKNVIIELCHARMENIKKTINNFQRILTKIINGYTPRTDSTKDNSTATSNRLLLLKDNINFRYFAEKLDGLMDRYSSKLRTISIADNKSKHRIFKHWKAVFEGIRAVHTNMDDIHIDNDTTYYSAKQISSYDIGGNMLLFYFVDELNHLMDYNLAGINRTNMTNFIIEFINRMFEYHSNDAVHTDKDIRKFHYFLHSDGFAREIAEGAVSKSGVYEEMDDPDGEILTEEDIEKKIDLDEEMEAMDMDMEEFEEGFASAFDRQNEFDPDN